MSCRIERAQRQDVMIASLLLAETTGKFGVEVIGLGRPEQQLKAFQTWFTERGIVLVLSIPGSLKNLAWQLVCCWHLKVQSSLPLNLAAAGRCFRSIVF